MTNGTSWLRGRFVLPMGRAPLRDAWIEVAGGRVRRVGQGKPPGSARDLGDVALMPGLVNAHTHLELSWMDGLVPPADAMPAWIDRVLAVRAGGPVGGERAVVQAAITAAAAMRQTGTVLIGDVSNTLITPAVLAGADLGGVVFHELLGFNAVNPAAQVREAWDRVDALAPLDGIDIGVAAHAPYSTSPDLFRQVARNRRSTPLTVHLAESAEELQFLRTGRGPFRDLLERLGVWAGEFDAPGCGPVEYLHRLGYLQSGLLAVHGVHLTDDELDRLQAAGAVVVTCPRSNAWVGAGLPRLTHLYGSRVPVAIGTDSLASAPSLNLFDELAEMRRIAPDVAAGALLDSATRVGAQALGFGGEFGTLAPGARAAFALVDLPPGTDDVEEYLVSGVPAAAIRPLDRKSVV